MRLVLLTMIAVAAYAQNPITEYKFWSISAAGALGATMVDGATSAYALDYKHSPGVIETNPAIVKINQGNNKVFGPGGFAAKTAAWGAITGAEWYVLRRIDRNGSPGSADRPR